MESAQVSLRQATSQDFPAIRSLIRRVRINPTGLEWRRFLVAVTAKGTIVGCGQLKPHGPGVMELASIAVEEECRHQGVARLLMDRLIAEGPRPLYLTCRSPLGPFYEKWGFRELALDEMPLYFRRIAKAMSLLLRFAGSRERLLVMMLQ